MCARPARTHTHTLTAMDRFVCFKREKICLFRVVVANCIAHFVIGVDGEDVDHDDANALLVIAEIT